MSEKPITEYARYSKIKDAIKSMGQKPFSVDDIAEKTGLDTDTVENILSKLGSIKSAEDASRGLRGVFAKKGTFVSK